MNDVVDAAIKGKLLIAVRKVFKTDLDPGFLDSVAPRMTDDMNRILDERLVASQWYPIEGLDVFLLEAASEVKMEPNVYAHHLGRRVVQVSMGRVIDTLVTTFATPSRIANTVAATWGQLYSSGDVAASYDPEKSQVVINRSGWRGHTEMQCHNMLGSLEEVASKVRSPRFRAIRQDACISTGAATCRCTLTFALKKKKT